uniref:NADH-ubiquinone oxidoreductase chain 2 n=2 Tax=Bactrocera TaxID=47832 RepID=A0A6G9IGV5_9MUSC|nr:NADH dehydrogenase subunit 2 [Bactrocera ruiliensis]YP_010037300.1 NADH dehydrogenase subunit 2 [Bactrocera thailandica]QIQ23084.1 NADH dehydrogenase subunit 2 [Bactrocera ruiliensis]QQW48076.1 NADH dehydrogenase subunit 2 [Bactrocera thailandica]WCB99100.1 NADH dehydrogenase subunit 2 [Bactrocera thailandica]
MFNNSAKIMFFFILMTGTLITVSSNSWLGAWMGLEINLLSFIPLMNSNNLTSTEASLKYFLTQAMASAVLLFAIMMMYLNNYPIIQDNSSYSNLMIISSLLLKSGAAPFHFWFPNVMEGLSWMNALTLMTWQKIAPLMLISYTTLNNFIFLAIIASTITGSLGGLNQTSLRKLMAFSSINHLGWMLAAMQANESMWCIYFSFYTFLSFSLTFMFNNFKMFHINQLFNSFFNSKILKFILFLNLLSLGGLPPFIGFLPKWLVIQLLVLKSQYVLMTIMTVMTLITLFFYLRLCFAAFMLNYYENNWTIDMTINNISFKLMLILSFISTFSLILISMIYLFL